MQDQPTSMRRKRELEFNQPPIEDDIVKIWSPHTPLPPPPALIDGPSPVDDLGRLSAEAVQAQYEHAAQSVVSMGEAVKARITKLESALKECDADMKMVAETAAMIEEKGKMIFLQIEEANNVSKGIRSACEEFRKKVG